MHQNPCGGWYRSPAQAMAMNPHGGGGHGGHGGRISVVGWGGGWGWPGYGYYGYPYAGYPYAYGGYGGAVTREEIDSLRRRVSDLEDEVRRLRR